MKPPLLSLDGRALRNLRSQPPAYYPTDAAFHSNGDPSDECVGYFNAGIVAGKIPLQQILDDPKQIHSSRIGFYGHSIIAFPPEQNELFVIVKRSAATPRTFNRSGAAAGPNRLAIPCLRAGTQPY